MDRGGRRGPLQYKWCLLVWCNQYTVSIYLRYLPGHFLSVLLLWIWIQCYPSRKNVNSILFNPSLFHLEILPLVMCKMSQWDKYITSSKRWIVLANPYPDYMSIQRHHLYGIQFKLNDMTTGTYTPHAIWSTKLFSCFQANGRRSSLLITEHLVCLDCFFFFIQVFSPLRVDAD